MFYGASGHYTPIYDRSGTRALVRRTLAYLDINSRSFVLERDPRRDNATKKRVSDHRYGAASGTNNATVDKRENYERSPGR